MGDELSDFFAKQDKKKKKQKKSSKIVAADLYNDIPTPPNEVNDGTDQISGQVAQLKVDSTDDSPKEKKKDKKKSKKEGTDGKKEEDVWREQESAVDYSGLRIGTTIESANEGNDAGGPEMEYDEHGQPVEKSGDGVWKTLAPEPTPAVPQDVPAAAPAPVIPELPNVSGGKYVPPSKRSNAAAAPLPAVSVKRHSKKTAPNMNSQEDFPTLGSAPPQLDYDVRQFETVSRGGGMPQQQVQSGPNRLQTSNMYSALDRN